MSAPNKLGSFCVMVNDRTKSNVQKETQDEVLQCITYAIRLSCEQSYADHTERSITVQHQEQANSVKLTAHGQPASYHASSNMVTNGHETYTTLFVCQRGDCMHNKPLVLPHEREIRYLLDE